jgi:hypothetical protein
MLDEHDIAGLFALIIRAVRAQDQRVRDQKIVEDANTRIAAANSQMNQARAALTVFGFESKIDGNAWDDVREAIGADRYLEAVNIARRAPVKLIENFAEDASKQETADAEFEEGSGGVDEMPPEGDGTISESVSPKISDAILEYLKIKGDSGAKVGDIKEYLSSTYNLETHEKTPGMTLYRLSQQTPPLARRVGRTWFFIPSDGSESKNPGAGTPGSEVDDLV